MSSSKPTATSPLLSTQVNRTHRLAPHPIRFPGGSSSRPRADTNTVRADGTPRSPPPSYDEESYGGSPPMPLVNRHGLPKLSRQCLVSEIQCYGKYIVAVLLVFGLGGVSLSFWIAQGRG